MVSRSADDRRVAAPSVAGKRFSGRQNLPASGELNRGAATPAAKTVVDCYAFFDRIFPDFGLIDLTEGMYHGDPTTPFERAQDNQANWLLDEVGCHSGSRILDIGCGYGRLLRAALSRGAEAVGITISPQQVARSRAQGLDVRLLNYRDLPDDWNGQFDGIVANGSVEHFVQAEDRLAGRADDIYRELFQVCHRLLNPKSAGRFATTIIHWHPQSPPHDTSDVLRAPGTFPAGSPQYHAALVHQGFGGSYPEVGQLDRCAVGLFDKVTEVDGTEDYHWSSETWTHRSWSILLSLRRGPLAWSRLLGYLAEQPQHGLLMVRCLLIAESWQWQFSGHPAPTQLLRQTWQRVAE